MSLNEYLQANLRQLVLDHLPYDRNDAVVVRELNAMTPSELLIRWLNWTRRMVPSRPRDVLLSTEFRANPVFELKKADITAFINDIESGADLRKYLSRRIDHGYVNANGKRPRQRSDLDLMLSAWGIHHLHFSQIMDEDGFVNRNERPEPIIFAVFRRDQAFLIDIMTHHDWAREHVIRVIVRNWPEAELVHEMKGVTGLSRTIDDDGRKTLRNALVNTMLEIDGKVYHPASGMMTSGVSIDVVMQADRMMEDFENFASRYETAPQSIISMATSSGADWPDEPEFVVEFRPDGYGVMEIKSAIFFRLGPD